MIKKRFLIPIIVIILAYLLQKRFMESDKVCMYNYLQLEGYSFKDCSLKCNVPLDMSPRKLVETFTP